MRRPLLALLCLSAFGCPQAALPPWGGDGPRPSWLTRLAQRGPDTIAWGYRRGEFGVMGEKKAPSEAARQKLMAYFARPASQLVGGENLCITHIDGSLFVGGVTVELCFSCNHVLVNGGEAIGTTLQGLKDLKPLFEAELGPRPPEPPSSSPESGY